MSTDINKVVLVGRLTRDGELSYTQSGSALLKFGVAVNRWRSDQNAEEASFFDVTVWGKRGESLAPHMTKGKQVAVEGELRQERWNDKTDGSKRSKVTIVANTIQLLGASDGVNRGSAPAPAPDPAGRQPGENPARPPGPPPANFEDDIPF